MCELLEIAREKQGNVSYYEMAKRLNVSDQLVRKWKDNKSQPNGINALKLADMAEVTPKEALKLMQSGYSTVSQLIVTSFIGIAMLALIHCDKLDVLCKIYSAKKFKKSCGFGLSRCHCTS